MERVAAAHVAEALVQVRAHDLLAYVSIRQHTSAYVSIRQHTSAYVSIRQHTSAYVSIRDLDVELARDTARLALLVLMLLVSEASSLYIPRG
jgi:hypothetical protein